MNLVHKQKYLHGLSIADHGIAGCSFKPHDPSCRLRHALHRNPVQITMALTMIGKCP